MGRWWRLRPGTTTWRRRTRWRPWRSLVSTVLKEVEKLIYSIYFELTPDESITTTKKYHLSADKLSAVATHTTHSFFTVLCVALFDATNKRNKQKNTRDQKTRKIPVTLTPFLFLLHF